MSTTQEKAAPPQTWEAHTGLDYTVVMLPGECTENASIHVSGDEAEELAQRIASLPKFEAVNKELLQALRKYGKHLTACACFDEFDEKACDCGFGKYEASL